MCFEYFGVFGRKNTLRYGLICGGFPVVGVSGYLIFLIIFNMCQPAGWIFEKNIKKLEKTSKKVSAPSSKAEKNKVKNTRTKSSTKRTSKTKPVSIIEHYELPYRYNAVSYTHLTLPTTSRV